MTTIAGEKKVKAGAVWERWEHADQVLYSYVAGIPLPPGRVPAGWALFQSFQSCWGPRCTATRATRHCLRCHTAVYCSKACQRDHWSQGHKNLCRDHSQYDVTRYVEFYVPIQASCLEHALASAWHQVKVVGIHPNHLLVSDGLSVQFLFSAFLCYISAEDLGVFLELGLNPELVRPPADTPPTEFKHSWPAVATLLDRGGRDLHLPPVCFAADLATVSPRLYDPEQAIYWHTMLIQTRESAHNQLVSTYLRSGYGLEAAQLQPGLSDGYGAILRDYFSTIQACLIVCGMIDVLIEICLSYFLPDPVAEDKELWRMVRARDFGVRDRVATSNYLCMCDVKGCKKLRLNQWWAYSKCEDHLQRCIQCRAFEDRSLHHTVYIHDNGRCGSCNQEDAIQQAMQSFRCEMCGCTQTVRCGNKFACWECDPKNYRRRRQKPPRN